ncbi:MAG TPA: hypothetical protein PKH06_01275 [Candidatus Dojkabacteria bacterium]|nr:hypothetical protein [Candidatus Dojkabacteria bacterium]
MKKFFFSLLIFIASLLLILSIILGYFFFRYRGWEKEFLSQINEENVIDREVIKGKDFNKKITQFSLSLKDVESLELNVQEVGSVILSVLDSYAKEGISIEEMYIVPSDSVWDIYVKIKYQKFSVWVSTDVNKDSVQSAQVYIKDIKVGPFSVSMFNSKLVSTINTGIADSIVTLNENGLVGRYIENIELTSESVVIKGSIY